MNNEIHRIYSIKNGCPRTKQNRAENKQKKSGRFHSFEVNGKVFTFLMGRKSELNGFFCKW